MSVRPGTVLLAALAAVGAIELAGAAALVAHAVVFPQRSAPGAYERYVLRVPNERPVPTVSVELSFPAEVRVVSFADVPGWTLTVRRDAAGNAVGATWTGRLGVERFVELPFVAVNPDEEGRLVWRAIQTYEGGERVSWSGPEDSERPASVTEVKTEAGGGDSAATLVLAIAALAVGLASLGLVLRRS